MTKENLIKTLIPAIFAILGVILGNYLTNKNAYTLFVKKEKFENQRVSYSKIMALKVPWTQSIQTNVEAKLLCEFYETRYVLFSHNKEDFDEAKRQNDRALSLIKDISNYQMQVFETLGLIQTCFEVDYKLQTAIDDIYNYQSIEVNEFSKQLKNQKELDIHLDKQFKKTQELLNSEYKDKLNRLIKILKYKLENDG